MNWRFSKLILLFFSFFIFAGSALAAEFRLEGGGTSIIYPQKRWLRDSMIITNTAGKYLELAYYIYYPQSQQEFAGFPQPSFLYLEPNESQKIYFFMDELWGKLKELPAGDYEIPVEITIGLKQNQGPDGKISGGETFKIIEKIKVPAEEYRPTATMAQGVASETKYNLKKFLVTDDWGVYRADLSLDENFLVTTPGYCRVPQDKDLYLRLFAIPSGEELLKYKLPGQAWGVSLSENGSYIAFGSDGTEIAVLDKTGNKIFSKAIDSKEVRLNKSGTLLAAGTQWGNLFLYELPSGNLRWQAFLRGQIRALKFYKNETKILAGSGDGYLYQFDAITGKQDWRADVETWPFQHIGVSVDEKRIVVGGKADPATVMSDRGEILWKAYVDGAVHWSDLFSDYSAMIDGQYYDAKGNKKWIIGGLGMASGIIFQDKYAIAGGDGVVVVDKQGGILWKWDSIMESPDKIQRYTRFVKPTSDGKYIIAAGAKSGDCSTGFVAIFEGKLGPAKGQKTAPPPAQGIQQPIPQSKPGPQPQYVPQREIPELIVQPTARKGFIFRFWERLKNIFISIFRTRRY